MANTQKIVFNIGPLESSIHLLNGLLLDYGDMVSVNFAKNGDRGKMQDSLVELLEAVLKCEKAFNTLVRDTVTVLENSKATMVATDQKLAGTSGSVGSR